MTRPSSGLDPTPGDSRRVNLPHPEIIAALEPGMQLLIDDGRLRLTVVERHADAIETRVVAAAACPTAGRERAGGGAGAFAADGEGPPRTFGLELGVDWVALSFVQRPQDIREARKLIGERAFLMAKIEKPSAVQHLREIARPSDAIMVARGDRRGGTAGKRAAHPEEHRAHLPPARPPGGGCDADARTMRFAPAPTRAEVTDVANAVAEGADAVMLSAETASGDYPLEAVSMMSKIIRRGKRPGLPAQLDVHRPNAEATLPDAISCAIRRISGILPVAVLVNYTESGRSSLRASRERPATPISA